MSDLAAFATALVGRLRSAGCPIPVSSATRFAQSLDVSVLADGRRLYWVGRICLASTPSEIAALDAVFAQVFRAEQALDLTMPVPWATRDTTAGDEPATALPLPRPGSHAQRNPQAFGDLDPTTVRRLVRHLDRSLNAWPRRRSRRSQPRRAGHRVDLRRTVARSRCTGWEILDLERVGPRRPLRRLVVLCDVSQSMQPHVVEILALMRAAHRSTHAEVFAFGTTVTRLTAQMGHSSDAEAVRRAGDAVADRFGGTRIASCLRELLRSRHGDLLRGAVCVIVSDGWDADDPEQLTTQMARVQKRAHRVVWVNPRMSGDGYEPRAAGMAAALPWCDSIVALDGAEIFSAVVGGSGVSSRASHTPRAGNA